ncbi:MAG: ATP-binding protein [Clostridia bacterium]|nr:ATP-binding protein [Clostridia bacterium]
MKQIVFISGKGGTGKSTVVASLVKYVKNITIADCDVDTPNLHILLPHKRTAKSDFTGAKLAFINDEKCILCGQCRDVCRFGAISDEFVINPMKCEGCGACQLVCPVEAITMDNVKIGEVYEADSDYGMFTYALLDIGAEGSGKLVTQVKKTSQKKSGDQIYSLIDGSPGIGCVVIASITGADAVVIVTEATLSGKSDLERVQKVVRHFGIKSYVCINKFDLNSSVTHDIEEFCHLNEITVIGKIPFEPGIVKALQQLETPMDDVKLLHIKNEIVRMWETLEREMIQ